MTESGSAGFQIAENQQRGPAMRKEAELERAVREMKEAIRLAAE